LRKRPAPRHRTKQRDGREMAARAKSNSHADVFLPAIAAISSRKLANHALFSARERRAAAQRGAGNGAQALAISQKRAGIVAHPCDPDGRPAGRLI